MSFSQYVIGSGLKLSHCIELDNNRYRSMTITTQEKEIRVRQIRVLRLRVYHADYPYWAVY